MKVFMGGKELFYKFMLILYINKVG